MKKILSATAILLPAIFAVNTLFAMPAPAARPMLVSGEKTMENTTKLTQEINWHKDLSSAKADAARQGKMIFWMHMLGQLDGTT